MRWRNHTRGKSIVSPRKRIAAKVFFWQPDFEELPDLPTGLGHAEVSLIREPAFKIALAFYLGDPLKGQGRFVYPAYPVSAPESPTGAALFRPYEVLGDCKEEFEEVLYRAVLKHIAELQGQARGGGDNADN